MILCNFIRWLFEALLNLSFYTLRSLIKAEVHGHWWCHVASKASKDPTWVQSWPKRVVPCGLLTWVCSTVGWMAEVDHHKATYLCPWDCFSVKVTYINLNVEETYFFYSWKILKTRCESWPPFDSLIIQALAIGRCLHKNWCLGEAGR